MSVSQKAAPAKIAVVGPCTKDTIIIGGTQREKTGGTVFYTSQALHKIGVDATAFAKLAQKDKRLLEAFSCRVVPLWSKTTTVFRNIYRGERREQQMPAACEPFTGKDVSGIGGFDAVHIGSLMRGDFPESAIAKIKKRNKLVSADAQGFVRSLAGSEVVIEKIKDTDFLRHTNILKCSVEEAEAIVEKAEPSLMAQEIAALGPREVVITQGSEGSRIFCKGRSEKIPAVKTNVKDATGAGDVYMAGYLAKRLSGSTAGVSARFAAQLAAKQISGLI